MTATEVQASMIESVVEFVGEINQVLSVALEALPPQIEVSLVFACGCRESWLVSRVPDDEPIEKHSKYVCYGACPACATNGYCASRRAMLEKRVAQTSQTEFEDIGPMPGYIRKKYVRMNPNERLGDH